MDSDPLHAAMMQKYMVALQIVSKASTDEYSVEERPKNRMAAMASVLALFGEVGAIADAFLVENADANVAEIEEKFRERNENQIEMIIQEGPYTVEWLKSKIEGSSEDHFFYQTWKNILACAEETKWEECLVKEARALCKREGINRNPEDTDPFSVEVKGAFDVAFKV
jgi:hypothetical protein